MAFLAAGFLALGLSAATVLAAGFLVVTFFASALLAGVGVADATTGADVPGFAVALPSFFGLAAGAWIGFLANLYPVPSALSSIARLAATRLMVAVIEPIGMPAALAIAIAIQNAGFSMIWKLSANRAVSDFESLLQRLRKKSLIVEVNILASGK